MNTIIITTPDELKAIVNQAIAEVLPQSKPESLIDSITLNDAVALLAEHGYPTSKAKLYKLTSTGGIPCKSYGNKLVFSRKELLTWAASTAKSKHDLSEINLTLARSARRKR